MLYVTHDQIEAMTLATRIGVLEHGALVQVGTPQQIYQDPVSSYVAARLGSPRINLLPRARWPAARRRRPPRPPSACGPRHAAARWPTATTAAMRRRRCGASSTSATRRMCTSALGGTAGDIELVTLCHDASRPRARRARCRSSSRAPLFFDAAGQRIAA